MFLYRNFVNTCIICDLLMIFCFIFICSYVDKTEHRENYDEEQTQAELTLRMTKSTGNES